MGVSGVLLAVMDVQPYPNRAQTFIILQVEWKAASAFEPVTYRNILSESTAVVHTIGTLFENTLYKRAVQSGSFTGLLQAVVGGSGGNPLTADASSTSYQRLNHDSGTSYHYFVRASANDSLQL